MVKQADITSDLESILGADSLLPPERHADFAVDGFTPQAAVCPTTYEQVAEAMRYAHKDGLAVIPWGGGTLMHIGNLPQRYDIALILSRLNQVIEHEPADLTVTCQAGITLDALRRHLAEKGQLIPIDLPWAEKATVGGILAANASGPSRYAYGSARDFTIGLRLVTADGRITRAGGRVVKNVAGYDLCKLYIGSLGTLGVIVEATFKVTPLPKAERTLVLAFDSPARACTFAAELHRRGLSLRALQLLNPAAASACLPLGTVTPLPQGGPFSLVLDLAGSPQAVERSRREIDELAQGVAALAEIDDAPTVWASMSRLTLPAEYQLLCKATALPTKLPALMEAFEADETPYILAQPTVGVMYASWPHIDDAEGIASHLRAATSDLGGTLVVEACSTDLKRRIDVFGDLPSSFDLMRRLKQQFDPTAVLSPGRFLGRL